MKSEKELFQRLIEDVGSIPMMDIHSHIDWSHPHARSARDVLLYHYIATELRSAGMPPELVAPNLPAEEAVENALPYFSMIRNTSTHWCLMTMLKDLYGFENDEINKENWNEIVEAIGKGTVQDNRYRWVLTEKAKIKKTFLTLRHTEENLQYNPELFVGALRLDPLITQLNKDNIQSLEKATGASIASIGDFMDALGRLFKKFSKCVAVTASFQPEDSFAQPNEREAEKSFKNLLVKGSSTPKERRTVSSHLVRQVLGLVTKSGFVFQIMLGVKRPVSGAAPPDYAIAGFEATTVPSLCPLFSEFKDVKFDVFTASQVLSHQLTVVAKNYPNVHVSGYWWYAFYPTYIRQFLRERFQMLPRNKFNGFFSDAYVVEWSYAKSALVRRQIAAVLAEMVAEGYATEELARELALDVLARNPQTLYGVK